MEQTHKLFRQAKFIIAVQHLPQLPTDEGYEIAFSGRSNAGKSSVINTLCDNRKLARTSKIPGRTQQIIFFELDQQRRFVDLPGYGYAKVPPKIQHHWQQLMQGYFNQRKNMKGLVLVMDIRHPLQAYDQQMIEWCQYAKTPLHLVLTKADKLSKNKGTAQLHQVAKTLKSMKIDVTLQLFSALKGVGLTTLSEQISQWLQLDANNMKGDE